MLWLSKWCPPPCHPPTAAPGESSSSSPAGVLLAPLALTSQGQWASATCAGSGGLPASMPTAGAWLFFSWPYAAPTPNSLKIPSNCNPQVHL